MKSSLVCRAAQVYRNDIAMVLEGEKQVRVRVRAGGRSPADP
jgi:hypothetical protein